MDIIKLVGSVFGVATMFLLLYGTVMVIGSDQFGLLEITFLMFGCFIVTTMMGFCRPNENGRESQPERNKG